MILDSAPGNPTLLEGWAAMRHGLPKGLVWYPTAALIWGALGLMFVYKELFGMKSLIDGMREGFLDFEVVDRDAKRLYVYSAVDELVGAEGVAGEVEKAREKGVLVKVLREDNTPHVQHISLDAERYWKSVEDLWKSAI